MAPKTTVSRSKRAVGVVSNTDVDVRDERRTGPVVADAARGLADVVNQHSDALDTRSWGKLMESYGMFQVHIVHIAHVEYRADIV